MDKNLKKTKLQVVVLAAGHGQRMKNSELPKVLVSLNGQPMIKHLLDAIALAKVCESVMIVVGQKANQVKAALGKNYTYITQPEQLGTGHAVAATKSLLIDRAENVMVLYGDHPCLSADTIKKIADMHLKSNAVLTMATVSVSDFNDWRTVYNDFGRILRNQQGKIEGIIEKKDATSEQLKITEVNPSFFCFQAKWLWQNLDKLTNTNYQQEYYLTDLVGIAFKQGIEPVAVLVDPVEALGVNMSEQLEILSKVGF